MRKKIILVGAFHCRGMYFAEGNHPWESFFLQRDAFRRKNHPWESFFCRGMIIAEGNHPWESFFLQRDAFFRRKSSLGEFFSAEGCISQKEIILVVNFLCRGMHFAEENHLCRNFSLQRDAFFRRKSSMEELFSAEGCISRKEIILVGTFLCRGMIFTEGNHL